MTAPVSFVVQGVPKGQPRPRAFARRMGNKFVARVYDAGTAEHWKSQIALEARKHCSTIDADGPVAVFLEFFLPRPSAHYRGKARTLREDAPRYHTGKPDADNLAKAVMDALTQLGGFWRDDSQVAQLGVLKRYADSTAQCGVQIHINAP